MDTRLLHIFDVVNRAAVNVSVQVSPDFRSGESGRSTVRSLMGEMRKDNADRQRELQ